MARLTEPPAMSTDTLEILKRKFLRQNREIARINSHQSQRIRELEAQCARMLSENLELRGEILRLENDIERNASQRIADHALEVRAQLEEQLSKFSSLLEGLGTEPPRKRHAPEGRRMSKRRSSAVYAPSARRLQQPVQDTEALAVQEGRLPPIPENRSYPRATMNNEEVRAMIAAANDSTDSPDLGPPPMSRFVDTDPVKVDSPSSKSVANQLDLILPQEAAELQYASTSPLKVRFNKPTLSIPELEEQNAPDLPLVAEIPTALSSTPQPSAQPLKAGAKRKHGNETEKVAKAVGEPCVGETDKENSRPPVNLSKSRPIKELPASRRTPMGDKSLAQPARKALAAKSTNESPKKVEKITAKDENKKPAQQQMGKANSRPPTTKKVAPIIEDPPPQQMQTPAPATAILDLETPIPETPLTPGLSTSRAVAHDTPPPSAVNSNGEPIRPSRRARAAVSYAEPNLRDKMRRPTKELFDAVSGEGKFRQRASISIKDEPNQEHGASSAAKPSAVDELVIKKESETEGCPPSPLAGRKATQEPSPESDTASETFPIATVTHRKRRASSMAPRESLGPAKAVFSTTPTSETGEDDESLTPTGQEQFGGDPYDFKTSSPDPSNESKKIDDVTIAAKNIPARSISRKSRASASFQGSAGRLMADKGKEVARKRASMAAPRMKASSIIDTDEREESSVGVENLMPDRVPRRRSMML